jgi:hypothetical protein
LKTTPTAEYTLRNRPVQAGQVVSVSSENACTASNSCPHSDTVQAYWYVGKTDLLALSPGDC